MPVKAQTDAKSKVDFNLDIRPILTGKCTVCHGGVKRKSGLSFLTRVDALAKLKSGERAIVPGQADQSEMIRRITSTDSAQRMPPEGKPLSPLQIEKLKQWIGDGAVYPKQWSFIPVKPSTLPTVKRQTSAKFQVA